MSAVVKDRKPKSARRAKAKESERPATGREKILSEAAALFASKGYAESGLREIAEMAGVRSSSVYHHFACKEDIYEAIIRIAIDAISAAVSAELARLPVGATPRMRVEAAIAGHLRALHANKPFTSTSAHSRVSLPEAAGIAVGAIRENYSEVWRALLDDAMAAGAFKPDVEPRILRPLILSTLNRTLGWFDPKKGSVETLTRTVVIMLSGIWNEAR